MEINLLAGAIGVIVMSTFGIFFTYTGHAQWGILAFSMTGSLLGFCYYNKTPAKIFMGDTGSLIIGVIASVLAIQFIELNHKTSLLTSAPIIAIAIMMIPLFDTSRVFIIRLYQGHSPFKADLNHCYHILIANRFSHMQATFVLVTINIAIILFAFCLQDIGTYLGHPEISDEILLGYDLFNGRNCYYLIKKNQTIGQRTTPGVCRGKRRSSKGVSSCPCL